MTNRFFRGMYFALPLAILAWALIAVLLVAVYLLLN